MTKKPVKSTTVYGQKNLPVTVAKEDNAVAYVNKRSPAQEKLNIVPSGGKLTGITKKVADLKLIENNKYNLNTGIILIEATDKPESQMTAMEKMNIIRMGISKKDLERLKNLARLDYDKLAKALSVTRATLINKKRGEKFNTSLSERIVGLADIYSYGYEVFEDEVRFNQWIFRPNKALGGKAPFDLLDNQYGREEVRNIIGRIDYGVYS